MRANHLHLGDPGSLGIFNVMATALASLPQGQDNFEHPEVTPAGLQAPRRGLLDRLSNWAWRSEQLATEAYLAGSTDIHDLEARIRRLERRDPGRYY